MKTWYRPKTKDTDQRRKLIEDLIRTRHITDVPQLTGILDLEFNIHVTEETVRRDLLGMNAAKDPNAGVYTLLDTVITRFDLYVMLRHACIFLLNDLRINKPGDTLFLYPDIGTGGRFEYLLEALRQDEELTPKRTWYDNLLGTISGQDVVVSFFASGEAGRKFYQKLRVLGKQEEDLTWVANFDEETLMRKVMSDDLPKV